ncbi:MAG: hypothetical protein A2020_02790 [Lentisphaerae bacterium GWF2_45_14]|nr:MAG: hypothetical protein A2020_02790 [Lentisphaerae bacterium GWF2_45_14]
MKRKLSLKGATCTLGVFLFLGISVSAAEYVLDVKTDRPEALYSTGEKIKFKVLLTEDGKPVSGKTVNYSIARDGARETTRGKITSSEEPAVIETVMENPGFALFTAAFSDENGKRITGLAGAGADPLKIKPGFELKDDFDKFWDGKKEELNKLPLEIKMDPVAVPPSLKGKVECFDIKVNCVGGKPVSGYFARPVNAAKQSLPAIVTYHGAGVRSAGKDGICNSAARGMLALDINAHGIDNGKPQEYYKNLNGTSLKHYSHFDSGDREKCYFLGMLQRVYRSLQFIKSQPEWDGKYLIVRGGSQGGGQSIAAAGLDPQVTFCAAFVPALCDHYGYLAKRPNGWPRFIELGKDGKPKKEDVVNTSKYFDGVNFASRIKAEVVFTVGFIDTTCCPSSVYAAYNSVPGKKQIINNPLSGHGSPPETTKKVSQIIDEYIKTCGKK